MTQSISPIPVQPIHSSQQRNFPAWGSMLVIVLCVALGGLLIWWYVTGTDSTRRIELSDNSPQAREFNARNQNRRQNFGGAPQEMPVGIRPDGQAFNVRAADVRMRVTKRNDQPDFRLDYLRGDLVTPEQNELMVARWRIARDAAVAKAVDATQEQVDKLKALPGMTPMVVTKEDRERIAGLWAAWEKSKSPDDEKKLLAAVEEIGKKSYEPTKKTLTDRAAAIKAVLSQEQWDKFKKMGQ